MARCEPLIDLFLWDVKAVDGRHHERLTGMPNERILENLRRLAAKAPGKLRVRVPIVPGCTDDAANLEEIAALVRSVGVMKVEIMPYHALGADKYASLGRDYRLRVSPSHTACAVDEAARRFGLNGVECTLGGE
jgi:pyruvate formate lyase activating enzyme